MTLPPSPLKSLQGVGLTGEGDGTSLGAMKPNRRETLITHMEALEARGMGCIGCSGTCCTYEANSMLLTPLEAKELFDDLREKSLLTSRLRARLEETISEFRLSEKFPHERSYLRKTYTCPFFNHSELGCPLPREVKPYGCLAFDSHHETQKAGEFCFSETALLEARESAHPEEIELNQELRKDYAISWIKAPIPNAILSFWKE